MWIIIIITILIVLCCVVHWSQTYSYHARLVNAFPGPRFYPLVGNIIGYSHKTDILYKQIRVTLSAYKESFRVWAGYHSSINIVSADDAEIILSNIKYIDKGIVYEFFEPWLGTGLLTSTGTKWHQRRKMLTPAFHFNILKKFVEIFGEHCDHLVTKLKLESTKPKTNIIPFIKDFTVAAICETAMGIKTAENDKLQIEYFDALTKVAELLVKRVFSPWLHPDIIYYISPVYFKLRKLVKSMHTFTENVIKSREQTITESDINDFENDTQETEIKSKKKRLAMLDLLISRKRIFKEINDEGIREEVDTFVFEGHDTTTVAICATLHLLALHKDIQEKVITELDDIFGDSKRQATCEDLFNLKFLDRCIKESLRLYPSVPFIARTIKEETKLTHHTIPANSLIFIHIYNVHRDEKYFPNAEKFDPDRFLPENCIQRPNYAYIPFSAGPRNCIGQKFAMLEMKSVISSILRNFKMEPIDTLDDITHVVDLVLRVKDPLNIKFIPRF